MRTCGRCGGEMERVVCERCDGEGLTRFGELYEEDPLWYTPNDKEQCGDCAGAGGWWRCGNSEEWCNFHPLPGRERVERGTVEASETGDP